MRGQANLTLLLTVLTLAGSAAPSIQAGPPFELPIVAHKINGNEELAASDLVAGGSGTATDPFVIRGHRVTTTTYGLWLNGTDLHVHIEQNEFANIRTCECGAALYLTNVENASVVSNRFLSVSSAVLIQGSGQVHIIRNRFDGLGLDAVAVVAHTSHALIVRNNDLNRQTIGVQLGQETTHSDVDLNRIDVIGGGFSHGISIYGNSSYINVSDNVLSGQGAESGILVHASSRLNISSNLIDGFDQAALWGPGFGRFEGSSERNRFEHNKVSDSRVGFDGGACTSCAIYSNLFESNEYGIIAHAPQSVENNTLAANSVAVQSEAPSIGRNNSFIDNGLAVDSPHWTSDFRWNWWGQATGPEPQDLAGSVDYEPWLASPP